MDLLIPEQRRAKDPVRPQQAKGHYQIMRTVKKLKPELVIVNNDTGAGSIEALQCDAGCNHGAKCLT